MTHRHHRILAGIAAALLLAWAITAFADQPFPLGQHRTSSTLNGYEETPAAIASAGSGEFVAQINQAGTAIDWSLTYRNLTDVTQSHIHFGRPATSGGIVLFLCTNGTPPAGVPMPQACPPTAGTISGTWTAADVIASTNGQGIVSGAPGLAQIIDAIRNDSAYVNVHTAAHPTGEIRARLLTRGPFHRGD